MSATDPRRAREGRVPPGQYLTERLPVLHAGTVPRVTAATWEFTVGGLVAEPLGLDFASFRALPTREVVTELVSGGSPQEVAENLAEKILAEKVL